MISRKTTAVLCSTLATTALAFALAGPADAGCHRCRCRPPACRAAAYRPSRPVAPAANSARGFGHGLMGRARRQNAGWGDLGTVESMWLASPAHASALLDPSITAVGLASAGSVWTFNAY